MMLPRLKKLSLARPIRHDTTISPISGSASGECRSPPNEKPDQSGGFVVEQDAAAAAVQKRAQRLHFRHGGTGVFDEGLGKLDHQRADGHDLVRLDVADPVLRQVRAGHDQLAGLKAAHEVADVEGARGRVDQMDFIFGVIVPAHRAERIAMHPRGEGFALADMDQFQIGLHAFLSPLMRRDPLRGGLPAPLRRGLCAAEP
ncbi:hypothetical protein [Paracoccus yeei]|uniref:hypothetical protein n=1 Tax=Paracoccus yeei TaxID=147645 RepID=UPI0030B891E1